MTQAAGVLFLAPDGSALFLKRGPGSDYPGAWCFPGGRLEGDESAEDAARREANEECGSPRTIALSPWTRTVTPPQVMPNTDGTGVEAQNAVAPDPIDFTTFICRVKARFEPTPDAEHTGHCWAPAKEPPEPLHPGCRIAIDRLGMDELGVAEAIRDGRLTSPQLYENVALFALRITGTGAAYRRARDEYVWRDPELYLNDEFLRRCGGLTVVMEHPQTSVLNSKEFGDRKVGSVMFAYVRGDEVWGIAKVYDAAAIKLMSERQLSTSPGVSWRDLSVNVVLKQDDGSTLLIEGKPSLLDHIAVCELGVWDKDGEPSGVLNDNLTVERTDSQMTEEEKAAAEQARKDAAEAGQKLDTLLSHMDSIGKRLDAMDARMDSMEEERKDAARKDAAARCDARKDAFSARKDGEKESEYEERHDAEEESEVERLKKEGVEESEAKDKAKKARRDAEEEEEKLRKDAEEDEKKKKEEEAAREDAARKDAASLADIRKAVAAVEKRIPVQMTDADFAALSKAQARADGVMQMFGRHAPRPMQSETLQEYRLRIANDLKEHSPAWKVANLAVVAVDSAAFDVAEGAIYEDARRAALTPIDLKEGELRAITRTDSATGRTVTEFVGRRSFVHDLGMPPQYVTAINTRNRGEDRARA